MDKKTKSTPMIQILDRLRSYGEFVVRIFGDKIILNTPVERWPTCDCFISFFSTGKFSGLFVDVDYLTLILI